MEKETYTAYDLEKEVAPDPEKAIREQPEEPDETNKEEDSEKEENIEKEEETEKKEETETEEDPARKEIETMIAEMGAGKVLEIIRDNRNAAIEQIMTEMDSRADRTLQSGMSVGQTVRSIFDLAGMA